MFRLRLHPSPLGLLSGVAVIVFWALLWVSVVVQLQTPRTHEAQSDAVGTIARAAGPDQAWTAF